MSKALSKWLRSGVIKQNIKDTLKSTIDALHTCCPQKVTREALYNSLRDILYNDKLFREESEIHIRVFNWFKEKNLSSSKQSVIFFSDEEQGSIIEHILNLVEKKLNKFLVNIIPFNVVETFASKQHPPINPDFSNADTQCMLNFIIENIKNFEKSVFYGQHKTNPAKIFNNCKKNVRNKIAHGIVVDENGRWGDHSLQHVTILACEVIICIGGDYKKAYAIKENLDNKIFQKWTVKTTTEVANNYCENQSRPIKRKYDPTDFCEMTRFVLEILKEVEETKEGTKQKIMKLALREDEYITEYQMLAFLHDDSLYKSITLHFHSQDLKCNSTKVKLDSEIKAEKLAERCVGISSRASHVQVDVGAQLTRRITMPLFNE
ncbi:12004_t:CDS:2, partial [Cetraspora pellucida]